MSDHSFSIFTSTIGLFPFLASYSSSSNSSRSMTVRLPELPEPLSELFSAVSFPVGVYSKLKGILSLYLRMLDA